MLADDFAFAAFNAPFQNTRRSGSSPHNVRPPRRRTDDRADPSNVPLAHVQARLQVLQYVLSCGCGRRKKSSNQRVAMFPVHFLLSWEVIQMGTKDMPGKASTGNGYLALVVDRASQKQIQLRTKDAECVANHLLDLLLMFGNTRSIRSGPGTEVTVKVVQHIFCWIKVYIDSGRSTTPGCKEQWRGWGGGFMKPLFEFQVLSRDAQWRTGSFLLVLS